MSNIKVTDARKVVNNLSSFYEGMLRNGFYLPSLKSSIVSQEYMEQVRIGEMWCPKFENVLERPCPRPPSKQALLEILTDIVVDKQQLDFGAEENKIPDKRWLLRAIATVDPDNEIFSKGYLPPIRVVKADKTRVDNVDNFFTDLP